MKKPFVNFLKIKIPFTLNSVYHPNLEGINYKKDWFIMVTKNNNNKKTCYRKKHLLQNTVIYYRIL